MAAQTSEGAPRAPAGAPLAPPPRAAPNSSSSNGNGTRGSSNGSGGALGGRGGGVAVLERLRPPDELRGAKLGPYLDPLTGKHLRPTAGDAVAFSCAIRLAAAAADAPPLYATPRAAPRVALLGDPRLPLGLAAALQRLALGEAARVEVAAELLEVAADWGGRAQELAPPPGAAGRSARPPSLEAPRPAAAPSRPQPPPPPPPEIGEAGPSTSQRGRAAAAAPSSSAPLPLSARRVASLGWIDSQATEAGSRAPSVSLSLADWPPQPPAAGRAAGRGDAEGSGRTAPQAGGEGAVPAGPAAAAAGEAGGSSCRGPLSGKPLLSRAAQDTPGLDLIPAVQLSRRLRPKPRRRGCAGWLRRRLSLNVRAPFGAVKGLMRCFGLRR
ncbi:hypothetical protein Rsub_00701 [Raphidocelis subcapitata]|uniref:Uncharacterized protein n=1 Tax=Raphidocelis subcapitata TaxID=307507 RepID=A0A2V0NLK8_9CHLO|nr:hypothetical protein Rsub_00701 [Raphidocelis subcapitata]|eukprot:GBF87989.1 hypothetical protein Rsub_00701 [Raphidocelis subcapitata]